MDTKKMMVRKSSSVIFSPKGISISEKSRWGKTGWCRLSQELLNVYIIADSFCWPKRQTSDTGLKTSQLNFWVLLIAIMPWTHSTWDNRPSINCLLNKLKWFSCSANMRTKACEFSANVWVVICFYLNIKRRKEKNGDDDVVIRMSEGLIWETLKIMFMYPPNTRFSVDCSQ